MAKVKWAAKQATVKFIDDASITLDSSTSYSSQFSSGTEVTSYMKDVTVTPPELSVEPINTLGSDTNGFQNAYTEEKPAGMAVISGTLVMQGDEVFETFFTSATNASGYTDYMYNSDKRNEKAMLVNFDDSTDEVDIVFKTAFMKLGERKPTGTDGHWEQSFEAKCLASNYREQFKD